jgi:hypothetical protein
VDERPDDQSGDSQEEDGPAASAVSSAADDDRLAATDPDDHGGGGKSAGFRLAPGLDLSGLASQPRFPSLILPGLDFSGITLALSAIVSKAVTGSRIVPELDLRGLVPQLDYTSFLPKIDLLPAMVPDFSAVLPEFQFPWAERITDILRPLRERLPPNWPGSWRA